jgi:hypothetical protein
MGKERKKNSDPATPILHGGRWIVGAEAKTFCKWRALSIVFCSRSLSTIVQDIQSVRVVSTPPHLLTVAIPKLKYR